MQFEDRIDAMRKRLVRLKWPLARLCREADVTYSTVFRWTKGTSPIAPKFEAYMDKIEAALAAAEQSIAAEIEHRPAA